MQQVFNASAFTQEQYTAGELGCLDSAASAQSEDDEEQVGNESGDESDGYGDEGLSWEAVMQGLQGSGAQPEEQ